MKDYRSLSEVQADLKNNKVTCKQLVDGYLNKIGQQQHLNAFLEVFKETALKQAAAVDDKVKKKKAGKLAGLVLGIKDNICYKNHKVSAGSKILEGFVSPYSATAVERLLAEDTIIIGRLNCDEFAMGSSNENSAYGNVLNPIDKDKVPGGSSGGSAAAVRAGICLAALGSETGGSVRQPASFCGVVGLKPTYGRVSRYGLIAYGSSLDQIGVLSNGIKDTASILEVIAGEDEYDSTSSAEKVPAYSKQLNLKKKPKIAYLNEYLQAEGLDQEIKERIIGIINSLKKEGHQVDGVDFHYLDYVIPTYQILSTAEASSNLARYDGVNYGYRNREAKDMETVYKRSRSESFGKEVKRRIMLGTFVLSSGYYDAYYAKGQRVRRLIHDKTKDILKKYDFILLPTTPTPAFNVGEKSTDPISMYLADIFVAHANLAGMPAISLPLGVHSNGLPFGIQIIADRFKEDKLLAFSEYLMDSSLR